MMRLTVNLILCSIILISTPLRAELGTQQEVLSTTKPIDLLVRSDTNLGIMTTSGMNADEAALGAAADAQLTWALPTRVKAILGAGILYSEGTMAISGSSTRVVGQHPYVSAGVGYQLTQTTVIRFVGGFGIGSGQYKIRQSDNGQKSQNYKARAKYLVKSQLELTSGLTDHLDAIIGYTNYTFEFQGLPLLAQFDGAVVNGAHIGLGWRI